MRTIDIKDKIAILGVEIPSFDSFLQIGDLTALRQDSNGEFYRSNYERGLLLYSLVAKQRPRVILEFGTGRGYGAVCMARALAENGIDGSVYTIDQRRYNEKQFWVLDDGNGPRLESLAWSDVWPNHFPASWLERIHCLNGLSVDVMRRWKVAGLPEIEFTYIDGGHDYATVKHDFYSMLRVAAPSFQVLFDDYAQKPGFGVCRLIDAEIAPAFQTELIWSDRRWYGAEREHHKTADYGMVIIESSRVNAPLHRSYPRAKVGAYLSLYRARLRLKRPLVKARDIAKPIAKRVTFRRRSF